MTIDFLVVDDDDAFRNRMAQALEERGFSVVQAGSSKEAIVALTEYAPDKVLLDLNMPEEGGIEVLRFADARGLDARIVVLTGYGSIPITVEAMSLGCVNVLTKPTPLERILRAFEGTLESSSPAQTVPSLADVEWNHIQRVLQDNDGNVSRTAKALGIHRRSLQRKLARIYSES